MTTTSPVPPIALGAMLFGTRHDDAESFDLLDAYVEGGGVWIDTPPTATPSGPKAPATAARASGCSAAGSPPGPACASA